jgi:hypothetical protein
MKKLYCAIFVAVFCSVFTLSCKKSGESSVESNTPPTAPSAPTPADAAVKVPVSPVLKWSSTDPDTGDSLSFDVYLGLTNPPDTLLISGWTHFTYTAGPLGLNQTYYWRVTAHDSHGGTTPGPVWSFSTIANFPVQGLVAYFPFNGNANDESGNGHDGLPYGSIMQTTDRFGNGSSAYQFDGIDDYILLGNSRDIDLAGNYTLAAWLFCDAPASPSDSVYYTIIAKRDEVLSGNANLFPWDLRIDYAHGDLFRVPMVCRTGSEAYASGIINALMWDFLAVTVNNDTATFWINAVSRGSAAYTSTSIPTLQAILIGWDRGAKTQYRGKIDDVRIFSRALTEAEILDLFHEAAGR